MSTLTQVPVSNNDENLKVKEAPKSKMTSQVRTGDRKTLKTLQLATDGSVIGIQKKPAKKMIQPKILASCSPIRVFEDKKKRLMEMGVQTDKPRLLEGATQTDSPQSSKVGSDSHNDSGLEDGEAYDLMVKEPIPETYWRDIAEERRLSLAEALSENETLHQSMEEMKEENLNLSQLAGQAEYLASVLNNILGEDKDKTEKDGDDVEEEGKEPEVDEEKETTAQEEEETTSKDEATGE